jgi:hypothetical protein
VLAFAALVPFVVVAAAALSEASSSSLIDAMEAERIIAGLHGWHTGQRETFSTPREEQSSRSGCLETARVMLKKSARSPDAKVRVRIGRSR